MTTDSHCPCELILKIGCNEYDEISRALNSLLRSCSIHDQKFVFIERQIQPTTYFGSFTLLSTTSKVPIQCQSLSCVIFVTNDVFQRFEKNDVFKSIHTWNFHHKIELVDEYKQIIARQDYYELSHSLPLWSVSHLPCSRQVIIRFNVFTSNFDSMLKFYQHLFQRKPDSSKIGFVLYNLSSSFNNRLLYQFSIKYSPSIQSYSVSQGAYLKFRLNNLSHFIHEYTSKLFTINKYEYYIYDPDGNLLHLHYLQNLSTNLKECVSVKPSIQTNDSGVGDSSDPSTQLFNSTISQIYPVYNDIDGQSNSSNDSAQCTSISSNESNTIKQAIHFNHINSKNKISVRTAERSEIDDHRFKQQQPRTVMSHASAKAQQWKPSFYESEPRLSNVKNNSNRYYTSMNNVQREQRTSTSLTNHLKSSVLKNSIHNDNDTSFGVDTPRGQSETFANSSVYGYLNAFLLKKEKQQQQATALQEIKQSLSPPQRSHLMAVPSRPKSAPLVEPQLLTLRPPIRDALHKSLQTCSKSLLNKYEDSNNETSLTDDDKVNIELTYTQSPRINIGITLDSRLRKTPVLDMLRSTAMQSDANEAQHLNRTSSLRYAFVPIARF